MTLHIIAVEAFIEILLPTFFALVHARNTCRRGRGLPGSSVMPLSNLDGGSRPLNQQAPRAEVEIAISWSNLIDTLNRCIAPVQIHLDST